MKQLRVKVNSCDKSKRINLLFWKENYKYIPRRIVCSEQGVVIPTLFWIKNRSPHAIVIKNYKENKIYYNDPNKINIVENPMSEENFFERWLNSGLDNDLLIISNKKIHL